MHYLHRFKPSRSPHRLILIGVLFFFAAMIIITTILRHVPSTDPTLIHIQESGYAISFLIVSSSFICFGAVAIICSYIGWILKPKK